MKSYVYTTLSKYTDPNKLQKENMTAFLRKLTSCSQLPNVMYFGGQVKKKKKKNPNEIPSIDLASHLRCILITLESYQVQNICSFVGV